MTLATHKALCSERGVRARKSSISSTVKLSSLLAGRSLSNKRNSRLLYYDSTEDTVLSCWMLSVEQIIKVTLRCRKIYSEEQINLGLSYHQLLVTVLGTSRGNLPICVTL